MQKYLIFISDIYLTLVLSLSFFTKLLKYEIFIQFLHELGIQNYYTKYVLLYFVLMFELIALLSLTMCLNKYYSLTEKLNLILVLFFALSITLHSVIILFHIHFTCGCFGDFPYFTDSRNILVIALIGLVTSILRYYYSKSKNKFKYTT